MWRGKEPFAQLSRTKAFRFLSLMRKWKERFFRGVPSRNELEYSVMWEGDHSQQERLDRAIGKARIRSLSVSAKPLSYRAIFQTGISLHGLFLTIRVHLV